MACYKDFMAIRIVFFDCDGTLTKVKSSWQYLHERLGLWDDHADAFQHRYRAGEIDYEEFCRRDAEPLEGLAGEAGARDLEGNRIPSRSEADRERAAKNGRRDGGPLDGSCLPCGQG